MKRIRYRAIASLALCLTSLYVRAQDKPQDTTKTEAKSATENEHKSLPVGLKLLIVVSESDGEKKVSSVPYTMYLEVFDHGGPGTKVRLKSEYYLCCRKEGELVRFEGDTNIDVRAKNLGDGRFEISGVIIRSWPESHDPSSGDKQAGSAAKPEMPTQKTLQAEFNLLMRDGQALQAVNASDSGTGRVLTITATINLIK